MANSYEDYQKQLANIYEQIQNRGPFQYDMNADPLYQQYKDSYINSGKLAMKDTMGQAAGLTGGYGSTYGQQVGQQAYNAYLQNMSQQIPSLYELAYNMYRDRGDDLLKQYDWLKANPVEKPVEEVLPDAGGSGGGGGGPRNPGAVNPGILQYTVDGKSVTDGKNTYKIEQQNGITKSALTREIEAAKKAGATDREIFSALVEKANMSGVSPLSVLQKAGYAQPDWSKYQPKKKPSYGAGGGKPNLMATK